MGIALALAALALWLAVEVALRVYLSWGLAVDFYGSLSRESVRELQPKLGVRVSVGPGWAQLGWLADPEAERYRIEQHTTLGWKRLARARFGSHLLRESGRYRVWAEPRDGRPGRLLGEVVARLLPGTPPLHVPRIGGAWRLLFRPTQYGDYVNDHTVFRDAAGHWRLIGITGTGRGDFSSEQRFAVGVAEDFPPAHGMREAQPVADFGELAWAPHVVRAADAWHLFWSPHRLRRMTSMDGISWGDPRVVLRAPVHRFFRDAAILEVGESHWLLHATARGRFFSRIDLYQSFDLEGWQYVGAALRSGLGSERNAAFASMESPSVVRNCGRYYLTLTYDNGSFFWSALLLALRIRPRTRAYDDTLVFHSDNPFDFGSYRGRRCSASLLTRLEAHAAEFVHDPERDAWYITTAGWPWAATLTSGEVAVAPLCWEPAPQVVRTRRAPRLRDGLTP